jgi:hypothetical protein
MDDVFCYECGEKLIKSTMEGFNPKTGEQNYLMTCPIKKCGHTGHPHNHIISTGFWTFWTGRYKCEYCDSIEYMGGYDF